MKFAHLTIFLIGVFFITPCFSVNNKAENIDKKPVVLIALLPFENQSNNVEAPAKVRQSLFDEMKKRDFHLLELEKIDPVLKEDFGITDGGQLGSVSFNNLKKKIMADYVCYGTVIDFGFRTAVALSQRKVTLKLKLVESKTGKVIWEKEEIGITSRAGTDAVGDYAINTAGRIFRPIKDGIKKLLPGKTLKNGADMTDHVADVDLTQETHEAIQKLLKEFPK